MFNEAVAIKKMLSVRDMTQAKLALVLGVSQPYIANKLRLLDYSDEEREKIAEYGLSERHARTLLRLKNETERLKAIDEVGRGRMNVARTEILVDCLLEKQAREKIKECSSAKRIASFEISLLESVNLLRRFGIRASAERKCYGDKIYFCVCIDDTSKT